MWIARQWRDCVSDFRDECGSETWDEVLVNFAILLEKGPYLAGDGVSKKLTNGKNFWELKARNKNIQPRLLFYIADNQSQQLNFVYCFIKKSNDMYKHAVEVADKRRKQIQLGESINVFPTTHQVH